MRPILERVFKRSTKENVIDLISQKNEGWAPSKKRPKKAELKEDFLALAAIINPDEIEDFIEMAVMSKNVGLPAYTYKINSLDFLEVRENEEENPIRDIQQIKDQPYGDQYLVSAEEVEDSVAELNIIFRLKEYAEVWKNGGIRNRDTLSAVYKIKVILDKQRQIVTIFTGNHYVQEVISSFLSSVQKWPLQNYRIREIANQSYQIGNASFKTALLLDLVSNRFQERGIFSNFKEIKFNTKNSKHTSQGIRSITINGRNLLTSYLACEYITLGSDILSFKIDMTFEDINFSTLFF